MVRNSFLSSTRRRGSISFVSIMFCEMSRKNDAAMCGESAGPGSGYRLSLLGWRGLAGKPGLYSSGRGPARIAAGLAQCLFHIADLLLELVDFLLLCRDLSVFVVDILAGVLLGKGFLRVAVILHLRLVVLALQDVEFPLHTVQVGIGVLELLAPLGLCTFFRLGSFAGCILAFRVRLFGCALRSISSGGGASGYEMVYVIVGNDPLGLDGVLLFLLPGLTGGIRYRVAGGLLGILLLLPGGRREGAQRKGHQSQAGKCGAISQNSRVHKYLQGARNSSAATRSLCSSSILPLPAHRRTAVA